MPAFGKNSLKQLATMRPDLQKVFNEAIQEIDFSLLCGFRNEKDQNEAYEKGASKLRWPKSRHNTSPSEAGDATPYPLNWGDIESFKKLAAVIKKAAKKVGVEVEWGGDWVKFPDYPHWQLKRKP